MFKNINFHTALLKLSFALLVSLFSLVSFSQDDPTFKFDGTIKDGKGKNLSGVTIKILQNGSEVYSKTTSGSGSFSPYTGDYGYKYTVIIEKEGFVKNTFEVNAKDGYHEDDVDENVSISFDYKLIEKKEGVDYSPLEKKPRDKYKFDPVNQNIDVDRKYEKSRKAEIAAFFKKLADKDKNKEKRFKELVKAGDAAISKKDWENAIKNWKEALTIKEDEPLAEKLTDAEIKFDEEQERKELIARMNKVIKEGDDLVSQLQFENAKEKYEIAADINPDSKIPKKKLKELEKKIKEASQDKNSKEFKKLMAMAQIKISSESFDEAKKILADAQQLMPKEKSPKKKLKEIEKIIKEKAENKLKYDKLISEGDNLLGSNKYEDATKKFKEASALMPKEAYPKDKLKELKKLIDNQSKKDKEAKEKKKKFDELVKKADKLFSDKKLEESKKEYNNALALFSDEKHPKERISEIDKLIAEKKKAAEELAKKEEQYKALIASADKQFEEKKYAESILDYQKALEIKEKESHPLSQIEKANQLIEDAKKEEERLTKLEEDYKKLLDKADKGFVDKKYSSSIEYYEAALKLKPTETYPTNQIGKINEILADEKKAKEDAEKLESDYKALIAKADSKFEEKKYAESILDYKEALKLKSEEKHPTKQIEKAEGFITDANKAAEELAKKEEQYKALIASADKQFAEKKYAESILDYQKALEIKEKETHPTSQIEKANQLIDDAKNEKERLAKLEEDYKALLEKADKSFVDKDYTSSIGSYEAALKLKTSETYPTTQITKIREILADEKKAKEDAEKLESDYKALIAKADKQFEGEKYAESILDYQEALKLKSEEKHPAKQIEKAEGFIADAKKAAEELAEKEKQYKALITSADKQFGEKKYAESILDYQKALEIKEKETHPISQIEKANQLIEDAKNEKERLAKLEEDYKELIGKADKSFVDKDYPSSIESYKAALKLKSDETYPTNQITKINDILADEKKAKEGLEAKKAKMEADYKAFIASADKQFEAKKYAESISDYEKALALKSEEKYPKAQIDKANEFMKAEKERLAKLAQDKEKAEAEYKKLIDQADKEFVAKDYLTSISSYESALVLKTGEKYPTGQISKIKELIAADKKAIADADAQKALDEKARLDSLAKAKLEQDRLAKLAADKDKLEAEYKSLIEKGDKQFVSKDYLTSISSYESALVLKTGEKYPKDQISKIKELIAADKKALADADSQKALDEKARLDSLAKAKLEQDRLAKLAADKDRLEAEYKSLIEKGDKQFVGKDYLASISSYESALVLKIGESYPTNQISKIRGLIAADKKALADAESSKEEAARLARLAAEKAEKDRLAKLAADQAEKDRLAKLSAGKAKLEAEYKALIEKGDRQFVSKDYLTSISSYESALDLKAGERYPTNQILKIKGIIAADKKALADAESSKAQAEKDRLARLAAEKAKAEALARKNKLAGLEKQYNDAINLADKLYSQEKFENSKINYLKALGLKKEQYPKSQIAKIDAKLKALAMSNKKNKEYTDAIARADIAFGAKQYKNAISLYENAGRINPSPSYPRAQIKEINDILNDLENNKNREKNRLASIEKDYKKYIQKGDEYFGKESYLSAKKAYRNALGVKPGKSYPVNKIKEIDEILAQLAINGKVQMTADDYFNIDADLYGEEVDMTENDGSILLTAVEDNSAWREYMLLKKFMDSTNQDVNGRSKKDVNYAQISYQEYEDLKEKIAIKTGNNDQGRHGSITSVRLFMDAWTSFRSEQDNADGTLAMNNSTYYDNLVQMYSEQIAATRKSKEGLGEEYDKYYDRSSKFESNFSDKQFKTNTETYEELEGFKQKIHEDFQLKNVKAKENDEDYEKYKDLVAKNSKTLKGEEKVFSNNEEDYLESTQQILLDKDEKAQAKIGTHNEMYKEYEQSFVEINNKLAAKSNNGNETITSELEGFKDKVGQDKQKGQAKIGKNQKGYEDYEDKLFIKNKGLSDNEKLSRKDEEDYLEDNTQKIKDKDEKAQAKIGTHNEMYKEYEQSFVEINKELAAKSNNGNETITSELEEFKDKVGQDKQKGQAKIGKNQKGYEDYEDKLFIKNKGLSDNEKLSRKDEEDFLEDNTQKIKDQDEKAQAKIGTHNEMYKEYEQSFVEINKELAAMSNNGNETITSELEEFKDKVGQDKQKGQAKIGKNQKGYEDYEDKLFTKNKKLSDNEKLSRKDEEDYLEDNTQKIKDKDEKAQAKIGTQSKEYEKFSDKISNLNSSGSKKNEDRTYKNSTEYTKIEENNKQVSDGNDNMLGSIFPEGVTQKVYEKKNKFGEITSVTVRRIVVKNGKGNDYVHKKNKSGSFYFKNGKIISDNTWDIETSGKIIE